VQFQTEAARVDLFVERCESGRIAFAEKADVDRQQFRCEQHLVEMPRARRARGRVRSRCGPGAAADHRRHAAADGRRHLLRRDEVDVRVDRARGNDHVFAAIASVDAPTTMPGVIPSMMYGLPALPMPAMRPSRNPMSAL